MLTSKQKSPTFFKESKHISQVKYVPYTEIFPAQTRYSSQNTARKIKKALKKGGAKYCDGQSILSKKKALPVVRTSFGYVLTDGHHDVMSGIQLKAPMIPIRVIADLSHLSRDDFWKFAEEKGWAYLYTMDGKQTLPPTSFFELIDDPNRYFAAITARKFASNQDGSYASIGLEYPLWIKINKDIPFIEFKIANALYAHGFTYDVKHMGDPPKDTFIEDARKILLKTHIESLRIVSERIHYTKIHLQEEHKSTFTKKLT